MQDGKDGPTLHPLDFEVRVGMLQPRSVAWSPVYRGEGGAFAMLAVGSKGGRVWLWRYRLPQIEPNPPFNSEAANIQLVNFISFCI